MTQKKKYSTSKLDETALHRLLDACQEATDTSSPLFEVVVASKQDIYRELAKF